MVDELADMFALGAREKGLQLVIDCEPEVPQYIRADAVKLRQVLINLLSNALKFTMHGSVTLQIGLQQQEPCRLSFAVADTGAGISAEEQAQLGHAFIQAQAGEQAGEGTGLGLAISRSFVQAMGGELELTSRVGQGTTIAFDVPVKIAKVSSVGEMDEQKRHVVALAPNQPTYRILAVDDRLEGRQLLARMLTPLGFEVREACNGEEAIAMWEAWTPHLIWMDMRMPVMDGHEATRRIRATAEGRDTIIIALTASSFEEDRSQILADGCKDFLRKPFAEAALFELLHKHLGIEFIYETPHIATKTLPDASSLMALPSDLKTKLVVALRELDVGAVDKAIEAIRNYDAALAQALASSANEFQYGQLLALIEHQDA